MTCWHWELGACRIAVLHGWSMDGSVACLHPPAARVQDLLQATPRGGPPKRPLELPLPPPGLSAGPAQLGTASGRTSKRQVKSLRFLRCSHPQERIVPPHRHGGWGGFTLTWQDKIAPRNLNIKELPSHSCYYHHLVICLLCWTQRFIVFLCA